MAYYNGDLDGGTGTAVTVDDNDTSLFVGRNGVVHSETYGYVVAVNASYADVTVAGSIYSDHGTAVALSSRDGVTITAGGEIVGYLRGIYCGYGAGNTGEHHIQNAGTIAASVTAIYLEPGDTTINNSGTVTGNQAIYAESGGNRITNSGTMSGTGYGVYLLDGDNVLSNTGTISGGYFEAVVLGGGDGIGSQLVNSGLIETAYATAVDMSGADDTVINSGTIIGGVALGGGDDSFDNHRGTVLGAVDGGDGNDSLIGSDTGNDVLIGGVGADELVGGGGLDVASYQTSYDSVTADLQLPYKNTGDAAGDTYSSIEGLRGGQGDDLLYGDTAANRMRGDNGADQLFGRDGNDVLQGDAGADVLCGGIGNDRMDGGAGSDTASYADATAGVSVSLLITAQQNTIAAGADTLVSIENLIGSAYADKLTGSNDVNTLSGGAGNDVIYGNGGGDTIDGGLGADILYGGDGYDTFVFDTALTSFDTIKDYVVADDTISLSRSVFTAVGMPGLLGDSAFYVGAAAHDADDRIIYNANTGALLYDADGNGSGAAVEFALLRSHLALTSYEFVINP